MISQNAIYWKRLWNWATSQSLEEKEIESIFTKEIIRGLKDGLVSYKPKDPKDFTDLQSKYADQTKLLSVVQTLQNYMDINCFDIWEIVKHYLCDVSYGTPDSALKNVAFIDTRSTYLSPKVWHFYYAERLYLLKLLLYIIQYESVKNHKYSQQFRKIVDEIGKENLKMSLLKQFEHLLSEAPPSRKIQTEFGSDTVRQEWAESNLREQLAVLQTLLLISHEEVFTKEEFTKLLKLFRKHSFGKNQSYLELLEERHREACFRITYLEICIFIVVCDHNKIKDVSSWLENTKDAVEGELTKLELSQEHSAMLITWMMLTLKSKEHVKLFETQYQHYGATALRLKVFEFLQQMMNSSVFSDNSKCTVIAKYHIFKLLNNLCDKFDGDGTLSMQPGIMQLCSNLLRTPEIAEQFWKLRQKESGLVSLWNTALEYFPYNFNSLSILSDGLAQAGSQSMRNLLAELKDLPVYTEIYNPNAVPIMAFQGDDAVVGRDYYPLDDTSYHIETGSKATIMERKEGTMVHFRTPYSYWTILNNEIHKVLDRKQHHQHNINIALERVYEGTKVLKSVLQYMTVENEVPKYLMAPSEGVFGVLLRFMRAEEPPLPILVECINVCTELVKLFPKEIHLRLINTGLLPRVMNHHLSHVEYANGVSFDSAAVGSYLVIIEQPRGSYKFLEAYIDMLCAFYKFTKTSETRNERITFDIILPGLLLILREVFPNICGWRYINTIERRSLLKKCTEFLTFILDDSTSSRKTTSLLERICIYSFLYMENSLELLKIISVGNEQLEHSLQDETNWLIGSNSHYLTSILKCFGIIIFVLKQKKTVAEANEVTPLEKLIFAQNKQKDLLKVVPRITSYINQSFNNSLSVLSCQLLTEFAGGFQMSLFSSLDMTAYQVRVIFLDRLRDEYETVELKEAILNFIATCIGTQPGLTEAFFMMNHYNVTAEEKSKEKQDKNPDESFKGILGYMADYLGLVKENPELLHKPIFAGVISLFHALWKNNMQILIKKLREKINFWELMASPLFNEIRPGFGTYGQIFNILGIELFVTRGKVESNLKEMFEMFFDTNKNKNHLENWISFIFSFKGRNEEEIIDKVPTWLSLLTSWKDFVTIFCKYLPLSMNIAHKVKMVAPCMSALLSELDELRDCRLVVILAELYVIMLANWKDDCFDNRKASAKEIDNLLTHTANVYESLHPRAIRALLSIGTVAISSLDYEIKANSITAQNIIRSVTNINSIELDKLFNNVNNKVQPVQDTLAKEEVPPVVLSLAMLEQCLDLYDDMFSGLPQWFQSTKFINKLLCCLQACLQNRRYYFTSLAALRCLTAYARGPFNKDLLHSDVDQFLWMQLLPPKLENESPWKPQEWWRVYGHSLDFISMMVMKHGQFFMSDAITFVGVHLDHLIEAILLPRQVYNIDSLNLCASTLNLVVQLVKYETTWRLQNINSLVGVMRSISACVYQCVTLMLRTRRASDTTSQSDDTQAANKQKMLHRTLEILHMATLCLLAFSPDLLSLLADPGLDLERWQPLVELHFGAPKISYEQFPQLTFGTIMSAICLLTRSLTHAYHSEEGSGLRSPHSRRRTCSCSPGERRSARADSVTSASSAAGALPHLDERLAAAALEAATALLASQALLAVRDRSVPSRHKQLVRRELASELTVFHDFVRKRILCAAHSRPYLVRNKLGAWPLPPNEEEVKLIEEVSKERNRSDEDDGSFPPPPPPKRASNDSMREYILRKHYLDKCARSFTKEPPSPVSHSTPTSDKKKEASRSSKRVSWADTTGDSEQNLDNSLQETEQTYSNLTDVQINYEEDYFHFMSVVFLYICQTDL